MQKIKVNPGDIIIINGSSDFSKDYASAIVEASKQFPDNKVLYLPDDARLSAFTKQGALEYLDMMKAIIEKGE